MKAEFKQTKTSDGLPLTVGKKYDVIDVKCKNGFEVSKVLIKNDKAEEHWYSAALFIFHAEATAAMKVAAVDAAMAAGAMATPEPETITTQLIAEGRIVKEIIEKNEQKALEAMRIPAAMFGA